MDNNEGQKVKIIFSGGGTGGSVTPLLAVAKKILTDSQLAMDILFVGTENGPERDLVGAFAVNEQSLRFLTIPAGKLRRYFAWQNFVDIFNIFTGFLASIKLIKQEQPKLIVTAGGFVSVPLVWAAWLKRVPVIIHQQDVRPGLANRLMAPCANLITVTFEKSLKDYGVKARWIGNPSLSHDDLMVNNTKVSCGFCPTKPLVLITGGGTGSLAINNLALQAAASLSAKAQIFHLTGKSRELSLEELDRIKSLPDYKIKKFLNNKEMFKLMAAADLVVSRCGLATLTELCELKKPAILIPMPGSHQEDNAAIFAQAEAAVVLSQDALTPDIFSQQIMQILFDPSRKAALSNNISRLMKPGATEEMVRAIENILKK